MQDVTSFSNRKLSEEEFSNKYWMKGKYKYQSYTVGIEDANKFCLPMERRGTMRDDTSFSDRKLSEKEFSDKYWMKGKVKYQYHTAGIEDARDEREQLVFNNVRALYDLYNDLLVNNVYRTQTEIRQMRTKINKYTRLVVAIFLLVINLIILGLR